MTTEIFFSLLVLMAVAAFYFGQRRAHNLIHEGQRLRSLPRQFGYLAAISSFLPGLLLFLLWLTTGSTFIDQLIIESLSANPAIPEGHEKLFLNRIHLIFLGKNTSEDNQFILDMASQYKSYHRQGLWLILSLSFLLASTGLIYSLKRLRPDMRARYHVDRLIYILLLLCTGIAVLTTIGILVSLIYETMQFFGQVPINEFLFGLQWSPQTALRADQVAAEGTFGVIPLMTGTLLVTTVALIVAGPIGLLSAIYLTQYAGPKSRQLAKPVLELLAGIPTVVYGFFAASFISPVMQDFGSLLGLNVASESALGVGLVIGVMIIPYVSSLSDDALTRVPRSYGDASLALGATQSETIIHVLIPAAMPGIVGAFLLAISRAIGETMIVVMAAGLTANLTGNPLESVTTMTVQITALLTGDQEFDSSKTLAAFALGLLLFAVTFILNMIALRVQRQQERHS